MSLKLVKLKLAKQTALRQMALTAATLKQKKPMRAMLVKAMTRLVRMHRGTKTLVQKTLVQVILGPKVSLKRMKQKPVKVPRVKLIPILT